MSPTHLSHIDERTMQICHYAKVEKKFSYIGQVFNDVGRLSRTHMTYNGSKTTTFCNKEVKIQVLSSNHAQGHVQDTYHFHLLFDKSKKQMKKSTH